MKKPCAWRQDDFYDFWITSCGKEFTLCEGTPKENEMKYYK